MIAIDTNVLLRYLLDDDAVQSEKAAALINGEEKVLLTDTVLVETVWTLKGKRFKVDHDSIAEVVNSLVEEPNIRFEDGQAVWSALRDFRKAPVLKKKGESKQADFADALIVNKAKLVAKRLGEDLNGVYTFDVAAQEITGARKP